MNELFSNPSDAVITIDERAGTVSAEIGGRRYEYPLASREGFMLSTRAWLRATWDAKYNYSFTWLGRPIIQLPDDMLRMQELLFLVKPNVVVETGIAHGGSLIYYASLLKMMGVERPRVVGVDIEIRPHNLEAINAHPMRDIIELIEADSVAPETLAEVRSHLTPDDVVLVVLDANHLKDHVAAELEAYSPLVTPGSFIVAADGIMAIIAGAPRTGEDWTWNNPREAALEFVARNERFEIVEPGTPFNEGYAMDFVSHFPDGFIRRKA